MVCEILGPAGAGKTTLLNAAVNAGGGATHFSLRQCGDLRAILSGIGVGLPTLIRLLIAGACPSWKDAKRLLVLPAMAAAIRRNKPGNGELVLLDEGPIFILTRLRAFGGRMARTTAFAKYQSQLLDMWAELLDTVCWIDAPDCVLIERIRGREKKHRAKEFSEDQLSEFLVRYRCELEGTLQTIRRRSGVELLALDSSSIPTSACAEKLLQIGEPKWER